VIRFRYASRLSRRNRCSPWARNLSAAGRVALINPIATAYLDRALEARGFVWTAVRKIRWDFV
jgi:hypothetical protein